jgi:hypothetical protein
MNTKFHRLSPALFFSAPTGGFRLSLLLLTLLSNVLLCARAAIPAAATNDALYAKGAQVVTRYSGVFSDGTNAAPTTAAVTIDPGFDQANFAALSFVDGVIRLGGAPAVAAIDNRSGSGKNFYARNVYVTGADALVRSGAQPVVSGTGTWKSINEYSCCNQVPVNFEKISMDLIDGVTTRAPGPLSNGEVVSIDDDASALPSDLPRLLRRGAGGLALIGLGFRDVGKIKRAHNSSNFVPLTRLNVLPIGADVQRHALQDGTTLRVTAGRAGSTLAARTVSRGARQSWNKERT